MQSYFRRPQAIWVFLFLLAFLQFLCLPGRYLGWEQDDVLYVLASRGILFGAYSLGISPGNPPLTAMTPGWPLMLLPAAIFSGDNPLGYQLWVGGWLALCNVLVWVWLSRRLEAPLAASATALFALNPLILSRSGIVMSEVPFLAVMMALLIRLDARKPLPGWTSGIVLGFAWLIRPGALPLFPAVWGTYLFKGRKREAAMSAAFSLSILLFWKLWVSSVGRSLAESTELAMTLPGQGPAGFAATALFNASRALTLWGRTMLPWVAPAGSTAALALGTTAALMAAWGVYPYLGRRRYEPAAAYLALGVVMHLIWPWWYERYLISFLPFLVWGLAVVASRVRPRRAVWILGLLCLAPLPIQGVRLMQGGEGRDHPELTRTYEWIRSQTPAQSLWTSPFYARDAFYTGRPFVPLPVSFADEGEDLIGRLRKARIGYILWQEIPDLGSSLGSKFYWSVRLREFESVVRDSGLQVLFTNSSEGSILYRIPPQ